MSIKIFADRLKFSVAIVCVAINVLMTRILRLRKYVRCKAIEANDIEHKSPKPRTENVRDLANERSRRCAGPFKFAVVLRHGKRHVGRDGFDVERLQESSKFGYIEMLRLAESLDLFSFRFFVIIH